MTTDEQNLLSYLTADDPYSNEINQNLVNQNLTSKDERLRKGSEIVLPTGSKKDKFIDTIRRNVPRKKSVMVNNGTNLVSLNGTNNIYSNQAHQIGNVNYNQNPISKENASFNDLMNANNKHSSDTPKVQER